MKNKLIVIMLAFCMISTSTGFTLAFNEVEEETKEPIETEQSIEKEEAKEELIKEEVEEKSEATTTNTEDVKEKQDDTNNGVSLTSGDDEPDVAEPVVDPEPENAIETEKVTIIFQVMRSNGNWATAYGNSSVTIKKGEAGSKTFTINANDKKDITINATADIYHYLGTWGDGRYDGSSGKIKLDRATAFNEYKKDGEAEVTVYIKADYEIIKNCYVDINYIDNIGHDGGGDSHFNNNTSYSHKFITPADTPFDYEFLYWENEETKEQYKAGDTFTVEANSLDDDKVINIYAVYNYQPSIRVIYHYKDDIKDTITKATAFPFPPLAVPEPT